LAQPVDPTREGVHPEGVLSLLSSTCSGFGQNKNAENSDICSEQEIKRPICRIKAYLFCFISQGWAFCVLFQKQRTQLFEKGQTLKGENGQQSPRVSSQNII